MAKETQRRLFDILTDMIATADMLTEQVKQVKRNYHMLDHRAEPPEYLWWNNQQMVKSGDGFVEAA